MSRPTEPVNRICYADDITVWASGVKIPELEHKINGYLTEMSCFLRDNSLLISAPKSTLTLFTPDPKGVGRQQQPQTQCRTIPTRISRSLTQSFPLFRIQSYIYIWIHSSHLMLLSYKWPSESVKETMAGTNWRQQKEMLLLTYKALGRSIANYASPVWITNASDTSLERIQRTQNEALRIITGSHKMSSIDHLHSETKI